MSKFCSSASIGRGNPLPPSTWPLACLTDFSAALAELKQRSAHRHAYAPTTHIVTWTCSNKLGSTMSLDFHCRDTSVHTYSLHILIRLYCFVPDCTLHNSGEKNHTAGELIMLQWVRQKFGQLYFCTHVLGSAVLSGLVGILVFTCSVVFIPRLLFYFSGSGFCLSPRVLLRALFLTLAPPSLTFTPSAPLFVLRVASPDSLHRRFSAAVPSPALNSLVSSACVGALFVLESNLELASLWCHLLTTCILPLCGPWL